MRYLKALQAYLEVATLGSVTAAARQLGMSQPSVSRMIQELERDLGQPLFERVGQRLTLTQTGMLLRDDVERALSSFSDIITRAQMLAANPVRPIRVAAISSVGFGLLPAAWNMLDPATRGEIEIEIASPEHVRGQVREGFVDIGIGSLPLEHRQMSLRWIGRADCVLAVPEGDPLAGHQGPVELAALRGRNLVGLGHPSNLPNRIRRALDRAGVRGQTVRTNSTMNALAHVRAGSGIAVVESISVSAANFPDVRLLPLATSIPYYIGIVTPSARPCCARCTALIHAVQTIAEARVPGFASADPSEHQSIMAEMALLEDNA